MRSAHFGALFALLVVSAACGPVHRAGGRGDVGAPVSGPVNPVPVDDAAFGRSAYQVLVTGAPSQQRMDLLAGVVRRQLVRAGRRFESGQSEAGLSALTGAFYLMRAGEFRTEMLQGGAPALEAGAAEVSRVGNSGKAMALYGMLTSVLPPGQKRQDVQEHLNALARWTGATRSRGPMQSAGTAQRAATQRALFDATPPAIDKARDATTAWVRRALESNIAELPIRTSFERDEAIEAYRAIRAGGASLIALYLRHGDPRGAIEAIDKADLVRIVPAGLRDRLERIADEDDPAAWADLFRLFQSADGGERPETSLDPDLARAAAWGAALGLYRSEPSSMRGATPLAVMLLDHGMGEVAPALVAPALVAAPTIEDVSWAMALALRAIVTEEEIGDLDAARRTFLAAAPILEVANSKFAGRVRPSPARLHYVMGALETRAGELARARPHVEAAARAEPSIEAFSALAAIERQRGDVKAALASLNQIGAMARRSGDAGAEAEALVSTFEIHRDQGTTDEAKKSLQAALKRTLDARQLARNDAGQARAERLLARVLEHYGNPQGSRRALERAYEASSSDTRQLAATLLDSSRRALTSGDLAAARDAVQRAVEARLPDDDLVYVALWLQLLEKKLNVASDGTAEEAYAAINDASGWPAKLRAWARGKLSDADLMRAAKSRVERTEATFYTAMASGQANRDGLLPKLKEVASSEAIQLVEVTIARDLIARQSRPNLDVALPPNVDVP
jgi:cellulose synthase operon protein C